MTLSLAVLISAAWLVSAKPSPTLGIECFPSEVALQRVNALEEQDAAVEATPAHAASILAAAGRMVDEVPEAYTFHAWFEFAKAYSSENAGAVQNNERAKWNGKAQESSSPFAKYAAAFLAERNERVAEIKALAMSVPAYAPAWRWLVRYSSAGDRQQATAELQKRCGSPRATLGGASTLRKAVTLNQLWEAEMPEAESDRAKFVTQVTTDSKMLDRSSQALTVLAARVVAARLTGQPDAEAENLVMQRFPFSTTGNELAGQWIAELYQMSKGAKERARELITLYPKYNFKPLLVQLLGAHTSLSADEKKELQAGGEELLAEAAKATGFTKAKEQLTVARWFVRHDIKPAEHEALLQQVGKTIENEVPRPTNEESGRMHQALRLDFAALRVQHATQTRDLKRLKTALDAYAAIPNPNSQIQSSDVVVGRSRLLRSEGRFADALVILTPGVESPIIKEELQSLWLDLGGTNASLDGWLAGIQPGDDAAAAGPRARGRTVWQPIGRAIPETFKLRDQNGKVWSKKDLLGKRVYVSIWASWCGPCKQELPFVHQLAELAKTKAKDLIVLTLNVDEDEEDARKFITGNQLTLPALLDATGFVGGVTSPSPIPRSWIINREGVVSHETIGFSPTRTWVEDTLAEVERLAP